MCMCLTEYDEQKHLDQQYRKGVAEGEDERRKLAAECRKLAAERDKLRKQLERHRKQLPDDGIQPM